MYIYIHTIPNNFSDCGVWGRSYKTAIMKSRYVCNTVGYPCDNMIGIVNEEGFKKESECNRICSEHVWKFTVDALIMRARKLMVNPDSYHSSGGLNLGHIKELVLAMADHDGTTLGATPNGRVDWINKMRTYIIRSNGNSEVESKDLQEETASLVRVVHGEQHGGMVTLNDVTRPGNGGVGEHIMQFMEPVDIKSLGEATDAGSKDKVLLYAWRHTFADLRSLWDDGAPIEAIRRHVTYVGEIQNIEDLKWVNKLLPDITRIGLEFVPTVDNCIPHKVTHLSIHEPQEVHKSMVRKLGDTLFNGWLQTVDLSYLHSVTHLYINGSFGISKPPKHITHLFLGPWRDNGVLKYDRRMLKLCPVLTHVEYYGRNHDDIMDSLPDTVKRITIRSIYTGRISYTTPGRSMKTEVFSGDLFNKDIPSNVTHLNVCDRRIKWRTYMNDWTVDRLLTGNGLRHFGVCLDETTQPIRFKGWMPEQGSRLEIFPPTVNTIAVYGGVDDNGLPTSIGDDFHENKYAIIGKPLDEFYNNDMERSMNSESWMGNDKDAGLKIRQGVHRPDFGTWWFRRDDNYL